MDAQHIAAPSQMLTLFGIDAITITDSNAHVVQEARARLTEGHALVALAEGRPWPVAARLIPLTRAIDDSIADVERTNNEPLDADALLEDRIGYKERCAHALDQARLAAVMLMTHLDNALQLTLLSQADNPGDDSTQF